VGLQGKEEVKRKKGGLGKKEKMGVSYKKIATKGDVEKGLFLR
jgi:hypothetical protein